MYSEIQRTEHLSEGQFDLYTDGSLVKNELASTVRRAIGTDEILNGFSQEIGIDPILISSNDTHTLLDAGLGFGLDARSTNPHVSNIRTNLDIFELQPEQIHNVVLTHLHHDHIAGLTYTDENARIKPTLPNATIWVQKTEWEHALAAIEIRQESGDIPYQLDDFYRLVADGMVRFIEKPVQRITERIEAIRTGGHTPGHQIVRIKESGKTAYYFGDIIPNEHYLGFRMVPDADYNITEARQIKMLLLKQAHLEEAELLFYHSVHLKHGKLTKDINRQFVLDSNRRAR
jgi:glyoxylase-like metal-dependent hydrolase (beta-lactamase superfamily II)